MRCWAAYSPVLSVNHVEMSRLEFDLTGPPSLVEPRLERAVEAEQGVPALAGNSLNPVVLFAGRGLGAKVDVHRAVRVHPKIPILADGGRPPLVGLEHRAGLAVVKNDRPELFDRVVGGQVQLVVFAAIERL